MHALVCDSTNVFLDGHGGSEADVMGALADAIRTAKGAVAATTFASNVARLRTLALLAREAGREVVLAGRAMHRMVAAARETGILTDFPDTVSEDEAKSIPSEHLFYLITGSQGEGRAALARIASGTHPKVSLGEGDLVIFSSKTIPGNEAGVARLCNQLSERGVQVLEQDDPLRTGRIHVSGHARREDLRAMYDALKPKIAVPMHGEHRHLVEHAAFAESLGARAVAAPNGTVVALGGARPRIIDEVPVGRVFLDGATQIGAMDGVVRTRLKLARQGCVAAALVVDEEGALLADPEVRVIGGPEKAQGWPASLEDMIRDEIDEAVESAPRKQRHDAGLEELAARAARRVCVRRWGKKPVVTVLVTRLED